MTLIQTLKMTERSTDFALRATSLKVPNSPIFSKYVMSQFTSYFLTSQFS